MNNHTIRDLTCAIVMQAVRDYFNQPNKQDVILRDLRSKYMDFITNGTSIIVAEQLELHPDEIRARMKKYEA